MKRSLLQAPMGLLLALLTLLALLALAACTSKEVYEMKFQDPAVPIDERVEDLLGRLTLEEKAQLMINNAPAIERLGIPAYDWWNEALHGVARAGLATVFPQSIALAATFDTPEQLNTFTMISDEGRAKYHQSLRDSTYEQYYGITYWTPNINIVRDPRWGRGMETYGEDPYLTAQMGIAAVKGLQGNDPHYLKTSACAKHYAVHSGPEWSRHTFDAYPTPRDLWETYLPAFEALVKEANVRQVMCAYNRLETEPCCASDKLLIQILRNQWNYQHMVVSDCGAIHDFYRRGAHRTHEGAVEASAAGVLTGTDMECGGAYWYALPRAIEQGLMTEEQLNVSLRRLLKQRFELGMFDPQSKVPWSKLPISIVDSPKHRAQALLMAQKSLTLLKNSNNVLPLSKDLKKIVVVGPNAADSVMLWANYNGFPSKTATILEGIRAKVPHTEVQYFKGCDLISSGDLLMEPEFTYALKTANAIIYVGGLSPELEGEQLSHEWEGFKEGERAVIELPRVQREMLAALHETGKPVIFVMCTGSAIGLEQDEPHYEALLNAWYGGQAAGEAVANVLFGDYNPAGRLPVTFYKSTAQVPDFEDYHMEGRTYKYLREEPLYPFGYGLSYTTFGYSDGKLSEGAIVAGEGVKVTFRVTNTGSRDGEEVPQVYVKRLNDPQAPIKALQGFTRIALKKGASKTVTIELDAKAFSFYNEATEKVEPKAGDYQVLYGGSSANGDLQVLPLKVVTI